MALQPIIGVSGSHNEKDRQLYIRENYMQSVLNAGAIPVLLPETEDERTIGAMLDHIDGLLLAGGDDVSPERYGEEILPACGSIDPQRDAFELAITSMAVARRMPVFGICRGIQTLAVALGGKLIQDIETQCSIAASDHHQQPPYGEAVHTVSSAPGGVLERVIGERHMRTNSMHHQAVRETGPFLRVEGRTEDGVIEAVSGIENDRIFAVQFHPEYMADHDGYAARLFEHFTQLARQYRLEK